MATNFAYVTHETPRVPTHDTATKRVYFEAHDRRQPTAEALIAATRHVQEMRHLAYFEGECGSDSCQVCGKRR